MRQWRAITVMACFFALAILAGAQQPPPGKKDDAKKDPQQAFEPRSGPGAGQKFLEKFVGDWAVEKKFFPRDGGQPSVSKGTCKQEMIHAGRFLRSEFTFEGTAGKSTGTGVIGFEPDTALFTSSWIDSRQTRMSFRKSKEKFTGEKIELFGSGLGAEPEMRKSKTITTLEDDGKKIVHKQFSIAADGTERQVMELAMTKK
ncbi:DUF1579 family protein [Limnoglobus roseus]|uniref:DUF1579 domain-containing protein n=1 Tax=Limnoglobus roseus TaxID=2598579 RepID=A0A5C1A9K7_9BACT|nr:DUF1579 family protein [Limnoglobus roseus]QEL14492.1 hypothetical protein PX52LOC_01381 [Limnoglobus roseus]